MTFDKVTVDLGTQFTGKQIQLRFRLGSDEALGDDGIEIDYIAFQGVDNAAFEQTTPENADTTCAVMQEEGGCMATAPTGIGLTLAALVFVRRRRRR